MLIASPMWFFYDFHFGSRVGMATETIVMLSIIIALLRFDK